MTDKVKGKAMFVWSGACLHSYGNSYLLNILVNKIWRRTFGFDDASIPPGVVSQGGSAADPTSNWAHCLKAQYGYFAKKCRKKGGVFKCCSSGYEMVMGFVILYIIF